MVESCVFTVEKQRAMGIPEGTLPVGWWIGFHISDDDAWERVNGLSPTMAADALKCFPGAGGYTALEVYINSIVEDITKECLANTGHETDEYFPFFILPEYSCNDYYKNR